MTDYNKYVEAVNKIYQLTSKLRANYQDQDNTSLIDIIDENKQVAIEGAKLFRQQQPTKSVTKQNVPVSQEEQQESVEV